MKRKFASEWLVIALVALSLPWQTFAGTKPKVETLTLEEIKAGAASFDGQLQRATEADEDTPKEPIFQQYGVRTFTAFETHPELVSALKKLNPKFTPHTMGTSDLSSIARFHGRTLLFLNGCFPHNCGGTEQIVAFEPGTKQVYLLQPTNVGPDTQPSGKFDLYGNPDSSVRAAMFYAYSQ